MRLEPVERLEPAELLERRLEAHRLVAAEPDPVAEPAGQQLVEVGGELGEVPAQPVVAQQRVDRVLELRPLLGRERPHERLHRRHPVGQLVDDVVERRGAREERAVLGQELVDVVLARLVAREPLREQPVEVLDHLALRPRGPRAVMPFTASASPWLIRSSIDAAEAVDAAPRTAAARRRR